MIKKNRKIIFAVIITIVIISSSVLYAFYIPNNDIMLNKKINYNSEFNLLSDNKTKIFVINLSLINVPVGYLNIYPCITLYKNQSIENKGEFNHLNNTGILNGSISISGYMELEYPHSNCIKIVHGNVCGESSRLFINNTQTSKYNFGNIKVNNKNSTLKIMIIMNTKNKNIKNIDNYSYNINATLKNLKIIDKTHGYFHYMDYLNGKTYYIKPEIKILNM